MEIVVQSPNQTEQPAVPQFRLWEGGADPRRERRAGMASVAAHVLFIVTLLLMPKSVMQRAQQMAHNITPLIAPPAELTQPTPNKGPLSKEVNSEALLPRPKMQIPPSPPSTTRPAARVLSMPSAPSPTGPALPEPPPMVGSQRPGPQIAQPAAPPQPPQIQTQERPKLAFENPAPPPPAGGSGGLGRLQTPGSAISEAVRSAVRGGGGGLVVGDVGGEGMGGIGEALNMPPSPGRRASNLELLTDPQGVDFRPYLIQVLAIVRRNWFAVIPESVKLGRRGRVTIQFSVNRLGSVPKLVIVSPSGTDALDRAAVAGISASNPFPPLPSEFKGDLVRLQFNFLYNMPTR